MLLRTHGLMSIYGPVQRYLQLTSTHPTFTWAILDSRATSNFLVTMAPKSSVSPTNDPLRVSLPNGDQVQLIYTCTLARPQLAVVAQW